MSETVFKRCPNGHYYQGDECPYCKSKNTIGDDNDCCIEATFEDGPNLYSGMKSCPNRHAYDRRLTCCPYCGDREVFDEQIDMCTGWLAELLLQTDRNVELKINGKSITKTNVLCIGWLQHRCRSGYSIGDALYFDYKSIIDIGGTEFSGKEFVKFIDFMADHVKSIKKSI